MQEKTKKHGFHIVFYPKYYCEVNLIEMVWGFVKSYNWQHCLNDYNALDGPEGLTKTLGERLPIAFVRKAQRYCFRFMSGYRLGLEGNELAFAVQKRRSHIAIPVQQKEYIRDAFTPYCTQTNTVRSDKSVLYLLLSIVILYCITLEDLPRAYH